MKSAHAIAARVRAGEIVPVDKLAATLDKLAAGKWSDERYQAQRVLRMALLGSATREGLHRAILGEMPLGMPAKVRGVLLDEDDPLTEPFPANPWGIRRSHSLVDAIDHVWDLFDVPTLSKALLERVLALVLLETKDGPQLGYVHIHERDSYDVDEADAKKRRPPHDRRFAVPWLPFGDVSMFIGAAPSKAKQTKTGLRIPAPLQQLYKRHAGLRDGMWWLGGPDALIPWSKMLGHKKPTVVPCEDTNEEIRSNELVSFFSYGDDRSDLFDIRDPRKPVVRAWGDGQLYQGGGGPFFEWLDDKAALFLGIAED